MSRDKPLNRNLPIARSCYIQNDNPSYIAARGKVIFPYSDSFPTHVADCNSTVFLFFFTPCSIGFSSIALPGSKRKPVVFLPSSNSFVFPGSQLVLLHPVVSRLGGGTEARRQATREQLARNKQHSRPSKQDRNVRGFFKHGAW